LMGILQAQKVWDERQLAEAVRVVQASRA